MVPTEKQNNFVDLSIGGIQVYRFSGQALHDFIERHKYRPISDHLHGYHSPEFKRTLLRHRKAQKAWYDK